MKLPIKIYLEFISCVGDRSTYTFTLSVPGCETSVTIAQLSQPEIGEPQVTEMERIGLLWLTATARERLMIRLFKLAYAEMSEADGTAIEWWISDIGRFLSLHFSGDELIDIYRQLSDFAPHAVETENMTIVRVD